MEAQQMQHKDRQRSKLYKVERIWWREFDKKNITFKDSREASNYATMIWIEFKNKIYPENIRKQVSRVKCTPKRGGKSACYRGYYYNKNNKLYKKITLSRVWGHDAFTVIHEMCHAIACVNDWNGIKEWHGPEFTKLFMFFLAHYLGYDLDFMCKTANEHNLQFHSKDVYLNTRFNKLHNIKLSA